MEIGLDFLSANCDSKIDRWPRSNQRITWGRYQVNIIPGEREGLKIRMEDKLCS